MNTNQPPQFPDNTDTASLLATVQIVHGAEAANELRKLMNSKDPSDKTFAIQLAKASLDGTFVEEKLRVQQSERLFHRND